MGTISSGLTCMDEQAARILLFEGVSLGVFAVAAIEDDRLGVS